MYDSISLLRVTGMEKNTQCHICVNRVLLRIVANTNERALRAQYINPSLSLISASLLIWPEGVQSLICRQLERRPAWWPLAPQSLAASADPPSACLLCRQPPSASPSTCLCQKQTIIIPWHLRLLRTPRRRMQHMHALHQRILSI